MPARKEAAHPFIARVSDRTLMKNLESLRQKALDLGASGAEVIQAGQVVVDERVRLKCLIPRCLRAGETPNCPPNAPDLYLVRKAFARYTHAILLKTNVTPIENYSPKSGKDSSGVDKTLLFHQKSAKIVSEIERLAYKQGYYLAMGLGGGSCKDYLCQGLVCQFKDSGRCRFPLRSRPAMEALGIDVFDLISKVGWDMYPLFDGLEKIPCAISVGLVFIH
jgi:predicted metal-binding protein